MAYYESIYILRPDLTTEQVEAVNKRVADAIAACGGTILSTELWGRRQLAYLVKKNQKGYYVFNVVEAEGNMVADLEAKLRIDEDVIKFMNVRVNSKPEGGSPLAGGDEPREDSREDKGESKGESKSESKGESKGDGEAAAEEGKTDGGEAVA
uniref:Small ribosomal subunit protein bS6 n=1 Tax=Magnetococcus massalia (strain MO-1) TaxID=451514 RepID=A0A1S7LCJ1_MAGMO|nr:30S ribosomal protein S6 [Candidatus Magnetococcus massalia]